MIIAQSKSAMSGRPLASEAGNQAWIDGTTTSLLGAEELGTNPLYVFTDADIVSSDSGGPLVNSKENWLG